MLKFKCESEDDIPESLKDYYAASENGNGYILNVDGAVPVEKLLAAQKALAKAQKDLDQSRSEMSGLPPIEEIRQLIAKREEIESADSKDKVEELVNKRTAALREELEAKLAAAAAEAQKYRSTLAEVMIDQTILTAAQEVGLKKSAAADLIARARSTWRLGDDEKPIAIDGDEVIYGKGGDPITPKEWLDKLIVAAPHLFEESTGGGSVGGGRSTGDDGEKNPWKDGQVNFTQQAQILRQDRAKAVRLAAQAGKKLAI